MAVRIRSLITSGPVLVPLSTGATVRLSPGQVTDDLPDVEVANNAKVEKLRRQGLIGVETVVQPGAEPAADRGDLPAEPADQPEDAPGEPDAE